jgi:serine phosphatase RsbU (regulator of sigma subunit)
VVVVGDVSGKGVQAATVTGLVRDVIRILVDDGKPMSEILCRVNRTLVHRGGGRYCTLAMASVGRRRDGTLDVCLHLAGHDRAVLVRADGKTSFVGEGGTALGLLETITSPDVALTLRPGDSLVFYTDGVTERRRGRELFGAGRFRDAAAPLAGYSRMSWRPGCGPPRSISRWRSRATTSRSWSSATTPDLFFSAIWSLRDLGVVVAHLPVR